eukprot:Hpha_TRINITY_DN15223_c2_g1::TRINITY_DN15223_c2_g1_i2::g.67152::m.67152
MPLLRPPLRVTLAWCAGWLVDLIAVVVILPPGSTEHILLIVITVVSALMQGLGLLWTLHHSITASTPRHARRLSMNTNQVHPNPSGSLRAPPNPMVGRWAAGPPAALNGVEGSQQQLSPATVPWQPVAPLGQAPTQGDQQFWEEGKACESGLLTTVGTLPQPDKNKLGQRADSGSEGGCSLGSADSGGPGPRQATDNQQFGLVLVVLEEGGIQEAADPGEDDAGTTLADLETNLNVIAGPLGGVCRNEDPFGGRLLYLFCPPGSIRNSQEFIKETPLTFNGLRITIAGTETHHFPPQGSILGCSQLVQLQRLRALCQSRRLRMVCTAECQGFGRVDTPRDVLWTLPWVPSLKKDDTKRLKNPTAEEMAAVVFAKLSQGKISNQLQRLWQVILECAQDAVRVRSHPTTPQTHDQEMATIEMQTMETMEGYVHALEDSLQTEHPADVVGVCERVGRTHTVGISDLRIFERSLPPASFMAVFDGQGGTGALEYASSQLPVEMARQLSHGFTPACAVERAMMMVDHRFIRDIAFPTRNYSGCSVTVALITRDVVVIGHMGDTKAVAARAIPWDGGSATNTADLTVRITTDHTCENMVERGLVEARGGSMFMSCGALRVDGQTLVTRGIGHTAVRRSLVLRPEISVYARGDLEFIVLGNSQLWKIISEEEVVNYVIEARNVDRSGSGSRLGSPMPFMGFRTSASSGPGGGTTPGAGGSQQQALLTSRTGSEASRRSSFRGQTKNNSKYDPSTSPLPMLAPSIRSAYSNSNQSHTVRSNQSSLTDHHIDRSGVSQSVVQEAEERLKNQGKKGSINVVIGFLDTFKMGASKKTHTSIGN